MRYKKIVLAQEAYNIAKRPLKLHGALRFLNKMILTAAMFGCYELYMSPEYTTSIKKKKYYYHLDDREANIVFDWVKLEYFEEQLVHSGFYVDYNWMSKQIIIKWRLR